MHTRTGWRQNLLLSSVLMRLFRIGITVFFNEISTDVVENVSLTLKNGMYVHIEDSSKGSVYGADIENLDYSTLDYTKTNSVDIPYSSEKQSFTYVVDDILYFDHTLDNHGSGGKDAVLANIKKIQMKYPEYEVIAGSLDDYAEKMSKVR